MSEELEKYDFDPAFQLKIASLFTRDTTFARSVKDLVRPEYFTETAVAELIRIVQDHLEVYKQVPDMKIIPQIIKDRKAKGAIRPDLLEDLIKVLRSTMTADLSNPGYVSAKVADFAKHQAIEQAFMSGIPMLEKGEFDKIADIMKKALSVGAITDGDDYDYFAEIENRTQKRLDQIAGKNTRDGITSGYAGIDAYLYHIGWGRKELSCIMGAAKAGKSMSLGDFTRNASLAGFNTYYDSLEVSKDIIAERVDAALASVAMRDLHTSHAHIEAAVKKAHPSSGRFMMRDHPTGMLKPSQLARQIEQYRAEGIVLDLVTVDYADIMAAEYRSDNLIDNLRSIYIDLRAIAHEYNCAVLTATQTNRDGAKAATAKATDVGDDWNKARTVDILLGINATEAEKKAGEARLTWLLSRNTEDGFSILIKQDRQKMQFISKVLGKV